MTKTAADRVGEPGKRVFHGPARDADTQAAHHGPGHHLEPILRGGLERRLIAQEPACERDGRRKPGLQDDQHAPLIVQSPRYGQILCETLERFLGHRHKGDARPHTETSANADSEILFPCPDRSGGNLQLFCLQCPQQDKVRVAQKRLHRPGKNQVAASNMVLPWVRIRRGERRRGCDGDHGRAHDNERMHHASPRGKHSRRVRRGR
mmetsp:Transcript_41387/g.119811  ORF Transcript_41387/g.119811 Transcript_41387/m.119811 type:complete len:207 (+) Transcript_41387:48-668(+)